MGAEWYCIFTKGQLSMSKLKSELIRHTSCPFRCLVFVLPAIILLTLTALKDALGPQNQITVLIQSTVLLHVWSCRGVQDLFSASLKKQESEREREKDPSIPVSSRWAARWEIKVWCAFRHKFTNQQIGRHACWSWHRSNKVGKLCKSLSLPLPPCLALSLFFLSLSEPPYFPNPSHKSWLERSQQWLHCEAG